MSLLACCSWPPEARLARGLFLKSGWVVGVGGGCRGWGGRRFVTECNNVLGVGVEKCQ